MAERSNIGIQLAFAIIALIAAVLYSGRSQFILNRINGIIQGKGGCAPVASVGDVTLHYFGIRGRAEGIRLMMEDNGKQYQDTAYTKNDWPAIKQKGIETGLFTFGQGKVQFPCTGHTKSNIPQRNYLSIYTVEVLRWPTVG